MIKKILKGLEKDLTLVEPKLRSYNRTYFSNRKHRYEIELAVVKKYYKKGRVLEIGSFPFHLTYCLKKMKFPVTGLDLDPHRAKKFIKKNKLHVVKCDIEKQKIPFENNTFSLIIFNAIFEHLRINPILTLKEINRVLKPGGIMILSTPNLYSLRTIALFNRGKGLGNPYKAFNALNTVGHMGHVREYSTKDLETFLNNTGFRVVDVEYKVLNTQWQNAKSGKKPAYTKILPFFVFLLYKAIPKCRPVQIVISKKSKKSKHPSN